MSKLVNPGGRKAMHRFKERKIHREFIVGCVVW